ncbi:MAG: hypothetical protein ABGX83_00220 [Nitrospira sp.]|nr:hypothetical protein [Candidatus Manganitrophaceae bacterium]HIL35435.1 hypothetical protein [Candidatus Manganitrophaceae bacterium]
MGNPFYEQSVPKWKLALVLIAAVGLTVFVFKGRKNLKKSVKTTIKQEAPPDLEKLFSAATLVEEGEFVIFGTNNPTLEIALSGKFDRMPIGKGKCAFCHLFVEGHKQDRCPDLRGLEARSHGRTQGARYKMFSEKYAEAPEPVSGLNAKARTGGEYILESIYCPDCYVVEGFGIPGSDDLRSEMQVMNHLPFLLSDYEIIAVASYLQAKDTPGDFSKVTAKEDWQNYFKKELPLPDGSPKVFASIESLAETEKVTNSLEAIIERTGCFVCHRIPGVSIARDGLIGPILAMKSTAALHLASPEYQKAVSEGRAKATTEREYVEESILNPAAFILPGFRDGDGMPSDYSRKLTIGELEKLVTFLLTIDDAMIEKEALSSAVGLSEVSDPADTKED